MKIKQIEIVRSYARKIQYGGQYENMDLFSSYKAICNEGSTEKELDEISKWLYQKAQTEVDLLVDYYQNPGKIIRGYSSIQELQKSNRALVKLVEEGNKKIKELELKINQTEPF